MVKKCLNCGRFFETTSGMQKYCSIKCSRQYIGEMRRLTGYAHKYACEKNLEYSRTKEDTLKQYVNEAAECNMSYGKYRMMRDVFGKSFEELKNGN